MKIIATVKFNNGKAYVLDNIAPMKYYRIGSNIIYGTNGLIYECFKYDRIIGNAKAFAGRKFTITIEDTKEKVECYGQWWDDGYYELGQHLGIKLNNFTYQTKEELLKCYVFSGARIDSEKLTSMLNSSGEFFYYDYYEYEKLINFDIVRSKYFKLQSKYNRDIKSIKKQFNRFKSFKKQILLNKL